MNNQLNEILISTIRNHISKEEAVVNVLVDILCIGKEAVYRRMRGDVQFTFDEVVKISSKLNFSLDSISGVNNVDNALFKLDLHPLNNSIEIYSKMLEDHMEILHEMSKVSNSKSMLAFNTLPYMFYTGYRNIAKFRIYKWMYQTMGIHAPKTLSNMNISQDVLNIQRKYVNDCKSVAFSSVILDRNAFTSFVKDIVYFSKLNLITKNELHQIKEELFDLLNEWEIIAKTGKYENGNEILIYISDVNFEACYSYYDWGEMEICHMRVYSVSSLSSQNPIICKIQKRWLESLKKYSTLITQSGEMQRIEFFNEQREIVNNTIHSLIF